MKIETKFNPGEEVVAVHRDRIVLARVGHIEITAGKEHDRLVMYHLNEIVSGTAFTRPESQVFRTLDGCADWLRAGAQ